MKPCVSHTLLNTSVSYYCVMISEMIYSLRIAIVPIPGQQFILAFGAVAVAYKLAHTDHFQTKSGKKPQTVSLDLISQLSTNAQLHTEATKRIHKHSVRNSICVFPVCGT